ncbi:MAG: DUF445 domain-containing protein [Novosphingobium sp.]|nr:DUF445 domain-containing protein [Novosphingobium sp.]
MRMTATGTLVFMALAFFALRPYEAMHPGFGYAIAFAEAAMVGGLADWFAVTALFRRPLGLPIPHTAIIPVNKDRIADTMAAFLRAYFLTPQVVARRLYAFNLAAGVGGFLANPQGGSKSRLREGAASLVGDVLQSLDQDRLGGLAKAGLRKQLEQVDLGPLMGQMLTHAIADRRHMPVLEGMIGWVGRTLESNEHFVREIIHDRANVVLRWTGLDERLASGVLDGIYRLFAEVLVQPEHPMRDKVEEGLVQLAQDMLNDPKTQAKVEEVKVEILANPAMTAWIDAMWERYRAALLRSFRDPDAALSGGIGESIGQLGKALAEDKQLQILVNRFARRTLAGIVSRYGDEIVRLVSETVKRWDAVTVTDRIEGAVGRDLQFIRINGTLVGGLVGLAIHAVGGLF